MHRFAALVFAFGLLVAAPALAGNSFNYDGKDQALMGLNGVITSPGDTFVGIIDGDPRLGEPRFVAPVTNRVVGLFTGLFASAYRAAFGAADLALAIFPVTHLSPDPLFVVIPGAPAISKPPPGF